MINKDSCFYMKKACVHDGTVGSRERPIMDIDLIVALRYRVKLLPPSPNKEKVMVKFDDVLREYLNGTSIDIPYEEGKLLYLLLRMRVHQRRMGASKAVLDEMLDIIVSLNSEIEHVEFWCCKMSRTLMVTPMIFPSIIIIVEVSLVIVITLGFYAYLSR